MPMAPDNSFDLGWKSGDQESYLQTVLANTRAQQDHAAKLKQESEEMYVDRAAFKHGDGAHLAAGATLPGDPRGEGKLKYRNVAHLKEAMDLDDKRYQEKVGLDANEDTAKNAMLDGLIKPGHPAYASFQMALSRKPLSPLQAKHIEDYKRVHMAVANKSRTVDAYGNPIGQQTAAPASPVAPKASDADHKIVIAWNAEGEPSYKEEAKKGSDYMNEAIALVESGVSQEDPRVLKLLTKASYGRQPFLPEGAAPFNPAQYNLSKLAPSAVPPAGAAAAVGKVSGQGATEGGATSAAWLREKAADPALSPNDRQTFLQAAAAADKVAQAGSAQTAAATAPVPAPSARPPGVGPIINRKPGDAAQIKDAKEYDDTLANIETVRKYLDDPELKELRGDSGVVGQTKARGRVFLQDKLGVPMGVPKNIQATRAALIAADAAYRRSTSGVNVTVNESNFLQNLLATEPSDPALETKLAIFEGMVERARRGLDATLESSNRQAIPRVKKLANPNEPASTRSAQAGKKIAITRNGVPGTVLPIDFNHDTDKIR